tara:strand:- start:200 stop:658 length:459 start_codon:yes stop_codon:yes gene_type:complete
MGTTTFSGPIKSGTIKETSGTTVGSNMKNTGFVVLSQTAVIDQTATTTTTNIIIPPNSQLISIDVTVKTAWSGGATTLGLGSVGAATTLTAAGAVQCNAVGIVAASPGTDATRTTKWLNTGTGDHRLVVTTANTGNGVGAVTVVYAQSNNIF